MAKGKKRSVLSIIEGIVIAILILIIASILVLYFVFSNKSAAPTVGGYAFYHTRAVNMEPEIPVNSAVIGKVSEIDNIKAGSVVLCTIRNDTVLSRVVQLNNSNGEMSYVIKFDTAAPGDTFEITRDSIIAKAIWTSRSLGLLLDFSTSTFGIMMIIIIPSFIIIVFQIIKIINVKRIEEEALSLDDLDDIMENDDDEDSDSAPVPPAPKAIDKKEEPVQKGLIPDSPATFEMPKEDNGKAVLNVNKNGKAELKKVSPEESPLFKYEDADLPRRSLPSENLRTPEAAPVAAAEEKPAPEQPSANNSFMSNILPANITAAVREAEKPAAPKAPEKPAAPAPAQAPAKPAAPAQPKPELKKETVIPAQAVVPKEKLAPPPKKSSKKTINDLMAIIDAEESKLK